MARLAQAGTVRVATWFDMPPFGVGDADAPPSGFDVEIAQIIAAKLGVPAERITWVQALGATRGDLVANGVADLVVATVEMNVDPERLELAGPYYVTEHRLLGLTVQGGSAARGSLRQYPAKSVCTVLALPDVEPVPVASDAAALSSSPSPGPLLRSDQVVRAQSMSVCLDRLRQGEVSAVAGPAVTVEAIVASSSGDFAALPDSLGPLRLGIGVGKGDTAFCAFIAETLAEAASSGSYMKAWTETAGQVSDLPAPSLPTAEPCR